MSRRYEPFYAEEYDSKGKSNDTITGQSGPPDCSIISLVSNLRKSLGIGINVGRGMPSLEVRKLKEMVAMDKDPRDLII